MSPLQIFKLAEENKIVLFTDEVENALKNSVLKNRKVCVISVAGIFRQGKSFALNFFLHFLKKKIQKIEKWVDPDDKLFLGFSWKSTTEGITEGILMWPEIFLTETESNEEIAIILMDTQGTADHTTSGTQSASLFALSVLISSVQIYNVKNHLNTDHLKNLQVFTGYGGTYCENSPEKPFQKLVILVRDWEYPFEYDYGFEGGKMLLEAVFRKHRESQQEELTTIQETIEENFEQVGCFLMPHPGKEVATNPNFDGNFDCVDDEFLGCVETFVETILAPENVVPKKINGEFVTVQGLLELIKMYGNHFKEGKQLNVKTIYAATAEAYHQECLNQAVDEFSKQVEQCDSFLKADEEKMKILQNFETKVSKMGTKKMIRRCKERLKQTLNGVFEKHRPRFEEQGLRSFCKKVFSYTTGGSTIGVAAVEVTTVITAVEATTAGAVLEAAIAGSIAGLGVGLVVGAGVGLVTWGLGKCVIGVKNSPKTKKIVSHASENVRRVWEAGRGAVSTSFGKFFRGRVEDGVSIVGGCSDGDGVVVMEGEERGQESEEVEVNGGVTEKCEVGSEAKHTEESGEGGRSLNFGREFVKSVVVVVFVAIVAVCVTFFKF
ncbi:atlastin-like isoform X1 [Zophobas morio]|uniref:atlastin-like isoform X1 n=2 Tax=Zophobas morio TaxID=2755281 RepID=UPI003082D8D1